MKDWVKEKLDIIEELYPEERLSKSKERWCRMWAGEKPLDRYPYLFSNISFDYYNDVFSKEDGLKAYLDEFIYRGFIQDDFIPAFFPGCKQGAIPGMFGAREIVVNKDYTCERIVHCPEDIDKLPGPSIREGTSAWEWLEMESYYVEECEGRIPVHVCDMQGPMDVCGQLCGYENLFVFAYEDEDRYHRVMELATQAFIMLWDRQKKLLGENFIGTHLYGWDWVPQDNGATLSADSMAMLSPAFFDKYYVSYLQRIADSFGSLTVHSCGNFAAVMKKLSDISSVKAVNASQMSVEEILKAGWDPKKVIINKERIENAEGVFDIIREKSLNVDVCFEGLWPCGSNGLIIPPAEWTGQQKKEIASKAAEVAEVAEAEKEVRYAG